MMAVLAATSCKVDMGNLTKKPGGGGSGGGGSGSGGGDTGGGGDSGGGGGDSAGGDAGHLDHMVVIAAEAGVSAVGSRKPAWCASVPEANGMSRSLVYLASDLESFYDSAPQELYRVEAHMRNVAVYLCLAPDDAQVQEQNGYFLQYFVNRSGGKAEDLEAFLGAFVDKDKYWSTVEAFCKEHPLDESTPAELTRTSVIRAIAGCDGDPRWMYPAGAAYARYDGYDRAIAPPSELARAMMVSECLPRTDSYNPYGDQHLARFATCREDGAALDAKKLEKEIGSFPGWFQTHARLQHAFARLAYTRHKAAFEDRIASDKNLAKILDVAAARAWKGWKAAADEYSDLFAAGFAFEDKPADGCWKVVTKAMKKIVKAAKGKEVRDAKAALTTGAGAFALRFAAKCAKVDKQIGTSIFDTMAGYSVDYLGPRRAVSIAMFGALAELTAKGESVAIDTTDLGSAPFALYWAGGGADGYDAAINDAGAVVKSVKKDGDGVTVEFKTEKIEVDEWQCASKEEFYGWDASGNPIWHAPCHVTGSHTENQKHDPVWIPEALADDIKPGVLLRSVQYSGGKYVPVEVWKDKKKKELVAFFGFAI